MTFNVLGYFLKLFFIIVVMLHTMAFSAPFQINFSEEEKQYLQSKPIIRVCVNPTLAPFEFLTTNGEYEGIGAELLKLVAQKTHLNLEIIQTYSWEESLEKARKNECDILNFIPQTLEFNKWLLFTEPLFLDYNVLLTRSEHPYISNLKNLHNATLALSENTTLFERLSYTFPNLTIFSVQTEADALLLVLNQKIDMTVRSGTIMSYTLRKQELLNLKISGILDEFQTAYKIGIVNKNELLRDILNKGIQSLTVSERENIINHYTPIVIDKKLKKRYGIF